MSLERVRARCERLLEETDVPTPFAIDEFCRRLAEQRGRPITLVPLGRTDQALASGAWVELADRDVILHDAETTPYHQQLIVAHEVGHMLCNHYPNSAFAHEVAGLLPSLDPALVQRILSRADYTRQEEQEAEVFATLLLRRAEGLPNEAPAGQAEQALLTELGSTFEE